VSNIQEILSEQDLATLVEDTGLTAAEINREYELAVEKAKAESAPKKAVNRLQRRKQRKQLDKLFNSHRVKNAEVPVSQRFAALPEEKQIDLYTRILNRVREENEIFAKLKEEEKENGEGIS
jgi:hypothetical protein